MTEKFPQLTFVVQDLQADLRQALQTLAEVSKNCLLPFFYCPEFCVAGADKVDRNGVPIHMNWVGDCIWKHQHILQMMYDSFYRWRNLLEQYENMSSARADLHEFEITVMDKACFIFPTHPRSFEPSNLRNKARARFCQLVFFKTFLDSVTSRKELWSRGLRGQQQPNWNGERDDRTCNCEDMG